MKKVAILVFILSVLCNTHTASAQSACPEGWDCVPMESYQFGIGWNEPVLGILLDGEYYYEDVNSSELNITGIGTAEVIIRSEKYIYVIGWTTVTANVPSVTLTTVPTNTPTITSTLVATNTPTITSTPVATNTPTVTATTVAINTPKITTTPITRTTFIVSIVLLIITIVAILLFRKKRRG